VIKLRHFPPAEREEHESVEDKPYCGAPEDRRKQGIEGQRPIVERSNTQGRAQAG